MYIYELLTNNGGVDREGLLNVVAFIPALLIALILHEIAHGLVALWNGDRTAKQYGRLSLNPLRHFDWIGLASMFLVGFGWARPVPVNPNNFKKRRLGCITVSLAGVLTNILLALLFAIGVAIFGNIAVEYGSSLYYFVYFCYALCEFTVQLNINLALFNILPLFPLDGYRFLACFVNERSGFMTFLRKYGFYILLGLVLWNTLPYIDQYSPFHWYIGEVGTYIRDGFVGFWGLIFYG